MDEKRAQKSRAERAGHQTLSVSPPLDERKSFRKQRGPRRPETVAGGEYFGSPPRPEVSSSRSKPPESREDRSRIATESCHKLPPGSLHSNVDDRLLHFDDRTEGHVRGETLRRSYHSPSSHKEDREKQRKTSKTPLVLHQPTASSPIPSKENVRRSTKSVSPDPFNKYKHPISNSAAVATAFSAACNEGELQLSSEKGTVNKKSLGDKPNRTSRHSFFLSSPEIVSGGEQRSTSDKMHSLDFSRKRPVSGWISSAESYRMPHSSPVRRTFSRTTAMQILQK